MASPGLTPQTDQVKHNTPAEVTDPAEQAHKDRLARIMSYLPAAQADIAEHDLDPQACHQLLEDLNWLR